MNRSLVIFIGSLVAAVALSATATVLILKLAMTEEPRAAGEKFFGSGKELPPIEKGQEMRPRW